MIHVSTKKPTDREIRDVTMRYGSFIHLMLVFDFGNPVASTGGLSYRFNVLGNQADKSQDFPGLVDTENAFA